jgi:hypothetical protein
MCKAYAIQHQRIAPQMAPVQRDGRTHD